MSLSASQLIHQSQRIAANIVEMEADQADGSIQFLRNRLRQVYWIGGGSGAGKSSISRLIATRHGLQVYSTDEAMADHGRRGDPADRPLTEAFIAMDSDDRWVNRSPDLMLETFHWFQGEGFGSIVDDLIDLPTATPVIAEGFRLLPRLVQPLLADLRRAVWLLPTPDFRRMAFELRRPAGFLWAFVDQTTNPDRALHNLLERDRKFTEGLADEAKLLGLRTIAVNTSMGKSDLAGQVIDWFGL